MPVNKQKLTTKQPKPTSSRAEMGPNQPLPEPSEFRQHLKELGRTALRGLLEEVMREELEALIGVGWGQSSPDRQGYRNGYYHRDLGTTQGVIADLKVPRDREGQFQTQVFDNYRRYEPQIEEGITDMFVAGVSTQKVGAVTETLLGVKPSPSAVSRMNVTLTEQFLEWRKRPLCAHYRAIYLDGVYYRVRYEDNTESTVLLVALGVDMRGHKEVLSLRASSDESKDGWQQLLADLRGRGVETVDLFVTAGNEGGLAALRETYGGSARQRCVLHKQRNVVGAVPKAAKAEVGAAVNGIWTQKDKAGALSELAAFKARYSKLYPEAVASLDNDVAATFTFYDFPVVLHRYIRTTNAIESLFSNVRDRTDQIEIFTNESSCLAIFWAAMKGIKFQTMPI